MPSKLNQLAKQELSERFKDVESAVFVDFTGVGSEETYALRKTLHEADVHLVVVKTTLARLALRELGTTVSDDCFAGPLGIAWSEDPVAVAKLILGHRKKFRGSPLKVKGGFVDRRPLATEDVKALSDLPDRQQLLGMVAGTIAAPLTAFIGVQAEIIKKLVYAIQAIHDKKDAA